MATKSAKAALNTELLRFMLGVGSWILTVLYFRSIPAAIISAIAVAILIHVAFEFDGSKLKFVVESTTELLVTLLSIPVLIPYLLVLGVLFIFSGFDSLHIIEGIRKSAQALENAPSHGPEILFAIIIALVFSIPTMLITSLIFIVPSNMSTIQVLGIAILEILYFWVGYLIMRHSSL